jgi:3-hydroxyisobutyrate dehydrogenase-like beta-hydroxyacid dehydrogenase
VTLGTARTCRTSRPPAMMVLMCTVAVIGLGAMGRRFARRFLAARNEVIVWNRTPEKATELVELGAASAGSPADAARRSEALVTIVSDPAALRAVTEGPDGIAAGAGGSTTVIEMSTVGPEAVRWLASALPSETGLLDAPVLGSLSEAEEGTLKVFVGGPAPLAERWTPLLSALGSPIHVGPLGAGASAKLVANATLFGTLALLGEVVALADGLGLSRDVTFDVLAATPLAGPAERRRPSIEDGEYPLRFTLSLAKKDAELITDAARAVGVDVRVLEAARAWLADAEEAGLGDRDYSTVLAEIVGTE